MSIPKYNICYKDQSFFMKLLSKLLFFNKSFMTSYTTTIGNSIYYPTAAWVKIHPVSAKVILLHELIHIKDAENLSKFIFSFLYLSPQALALLCLPLMFIHWWLGLALTILFLTPLPSYFRMKFELKAYTFSIYTIYKLAKKEDYKIDINAQIDFYTDQFKDSYYYFMWPFGSSVKNHLNAAFEAFQNDEQPFYEQEYYDMIDGLIASDEKLF